MLHSSPGGLPWCDDPRADVKSLAIPLAGNLDTLVGGWDPVAIFYYIVGAAIPDWLGLVRL